MQKKSRIYWFEPLFYLVFGLFHMHRVWGLIDRMGYADYWLGVLEEQGALYYCIMISLLVLCISGILVFIKNIGNNYWWRWVYIFGGGYVMFDVTAIFFHIPWWNNLLLFMFDTNNSVWNIIWGGLVLIGILSFCLGIYLFRVRKRTV